MSFRLKFRLSDFVANFDPEKPHESHPILAFVGSAILRPPAVSRILTRRLTAQAVHEFELRFEINEELANHEFPYPVAIMAQLHAHRPSDGGEITEVDCACSDRYIIPGLLQPGEPTDLGLFEMIDYPGLLEDLRFHTVPEEIMLQKGPDPTLPWTTKATFKLTCTLIDPLPPSLRGKSRANVSLEYFNKTLREEVARHQLEAKANLDRLTPRLSGLHDFEVQVYTLGAGIDVPTGILLANQNYAASASEALFESRITQVLIARHIEPAKFVAALQHVTNSLSRFEREAEGVTGNLLQPSTIEPPTTFQLECTNVVIEALLTMPQCALPYTFDKSVTPGTELDVERPDMRARRAVDCEDTSIEISIAHQELVRKRLLWRSEMVKLSAEFLHYYECIITRTLTTPNFRDDSKTKVEDGELHVCPFLLMRVYLYDMMIRGEASNLLLSDEDRLYYKLACKSVAFKPAWWYHGVSRSESHPSTYYSDISLPTFPNLHALRPPARAVYVADGCTSMVPSQGPPRLTHPENPAYFENLESHREQIYTTLLEGVSHQIEHEYPLVWNSELEKQSKGNPFAKAQSRFYHTISTFSVNNPIVAAIRERGSLAVPNTRQTQKSVLEFAFMDSDGYQGVRFDTLVSLDEPEVVGKLPFAVPYTLPSRAFFEAAVDLLAIQEPIYPMLPREMDQTLIWNRHIIPAAQRAIRPSNLFAEFPLHETNYSPEVVNVLETIMVPGIGRSIASETFFINLGACEPAKRQEFLNEPPIQIDFSALGLSLPEMHQLMATTNGQKELIRLASHQTKDDPLLWILTLYEKLLEQPLSIYLVRVYFDSKESGPVLHY